MPDQPASPKKRLVKNPETFRERAVKAAEAGDQPSRGRKLRDAGSKIVTPVTTPVGKAGKKVFDRQPFRFIGRILRFVGLIIFPKYFRKSWQELRQVEWPSWRESLRLTSAVLIFALIFGASIAAVDYGLDKVFRHLLLK